MTLFPPRVTLRVTPLPAHCLPTRSSSRGVSPMELPFTIVFEPPSRAELRALLRWRGRWAVALLLLLAIGLAYLLAHVAQADAGVAVALTPLTVRSHPAGAAVWLDGHQRGTTPLALSVERGAHSIV